MSGVSITTIDACEPYAGPNAIPGICFRPVGKALGVTAWGMNVLEIEAGCTTYPEHDHAGDGQEEVYLVLDGAGTLVTAHGQQPLQKGLLVRVGPTEKRKLQAGDDGLVLLAVGGTPGQAYQPRG